MNTKAKNVAANLKNPKTRMVFFGGIALILVVLVVAWSVLFRKSNTDEQVLETQVSAPPEIGVASGMTDGTPNVATDEYDRLMAENNQQAAIQAKEGGGSAIPVPRTGVAESSIEMKPRDMTSAAPTTSAATTQAGDAQAGEKERQAYEAAVQARQANMKKQMEAVRSYWSINPHQRYEIEAKVAEQSEKSATGAPSASAVGTQSQPGPTTAANTMPNATAQTPTQQNVDIAMGDMLYATLDFGINTDDPASANFVQATIREPGPFQGAKVIGSLEEGDQYAKTVGIHFTQLRVPGETQPRQIDAWAVNPSTSRPSLASDVNNHYISRGVSTFIGSFMEGYSQGLLQGGRQQRVVAADNGAIVVQQDAYTSRQLAQIGVGNVGKSMSQMFAQSATRQRTVTVDANVDLGVWFLKDVASAR